MKIQDKIYEITLQSAFAKSKVIFIYEIGEISDFIGKEESEKIRDLFFKNNIKVKQISNCSSLPKFSENKEFINKVMNFRYIPEVIFTIKSEILIFDDKIAIYNKNTFELIENKIFADNQKQLFMSIWEQWESPKLDFEYKPNHSFYKSIDLFVNGIQIIVWPDCDAKESYTNFNKKKLEKYFENIINKNFEVYRNIDYIVSFIWNFEWNKMAAIWKFKENHVDDRSWPLSEVSVYKNWEKCENLWLASWNTLLVLWFEEKFRRQSKNLKSYLDWPIPKMPLEIVNGKDFFD